MEILEEPALVSKYLTHFKPIHNPVMIQIGANEGMFEYIKPDGKDFIFEFLLNNPQWEAILVEPIPEIFNVLKSNSCNHKNKLSFLNCAVTDKVEEQILSIAGKEGKISSLHKPSEDRKKLITSEILVQCIPYSFMCNIFGMNKVDFVKIDAEGFDEVIVKSILTTSKAELLPKFILWESIKENKEFEEYVASMGYTIFLTGLNSAQQYMDRVAIKDYIVIPQELGST